MKKFLFSANLTVIALTLFCLIEKEPFDYTHLYLFLAVTFLFFLLRAAEIILNFKLSGLSEKRFLPAECLSFLFSAAAFGITSIPFSAESLSLYISQMSLGCLLIVFILLFTIFTHKTYDPKKDEETRASYGVFEGKLPPKHIKALYDESSPILCGAVLPVLISAFTFSDKVKISAIVFFLFSFFTAVLYGNLKIKPVLNEKKRRYERELREQLRKEEGL